jgi:peptidoglycan L-alanyl-D-glutamate endopeptidase CwlK
MKHIIQVQIDHPVPVKMAQSPTEPKHDNWETIERITKVISVALIPVVLAIGGWLIQKQLQVESIKKDYVQLAVTILKEPESTRISPEIRKWAAQLLNDNSPTKLSMEGLSQLSKGTVLLPGYQASARPIESLQPPVAALARKLIERAAEEGIEITILRTTVTDEEQAALYAKGRTAPGVPVTFARAGKSMHNRGLAFDIAPVVGGKPVFDDLALYKKLGQLGKGLGLTWGGDWRMPDYPHFEYKVDSSGANEK